MSDHDRFRALLALHVASGLSQKENELDEHLGQCALCRAELAGLRAIAADFKSIPLPQPSLGLAQRTRARIAAELAAREERRQHHKLLALVIGFAWMVTVLSWIVGRFLVADVAAWLRISPETCMTVFISYTIFAITASLAMIGLMATRHRHERRLI
jgi:hypothetical protein